MKGFRGLKFCPELRTVTSGSIAKSPFNQDCMKIALISIFIIMTSIQSFGQDSTTQATNYNKFEEEYKRYRDSVDKYGLVPAVSMMSSTTRQVCPFTSPITFITWATFASSRRLLTMANSAFRRFENARARSTPPASGDTTVKCGRFSF